MLTETGSGGLTELKDHLQDGNASFAYVRISYANDKESQREKFILVVWIGEGVKVMRKAKISVHTADVKSVLRTFSIEVAAKDKDDLDEEAIVVRLRKVRSSFAFLAYTTNRPVTTGWRGQLRSCLDASISFTGCSFLGFHWGPTQLLHVE